MVDRSFDYNPEFEYEPVTGGRIENEDRPQTRYDHVRSTYADINVITSRLQAILALANSLEGQVETLLSTKSLAVTESPLDDDLRLAQQTEWPVGSSIPKQYITYKYYKYLKLRDTASSAYIRKRYKEAIRDVTGSNALDLMQIVDFIRNEAFLAQEFITNTIGSMDDTAEFRSAELVQDWSGSALNQFQQIQEILQAGGQVNSLPEDELDSLTPQEAGKAQAVFKVKLNSVNDEIEQQTEVMKRDWVQYADVFFSRYLSPALNFRLNVNRSVYPQNTTIGRELYSAAGALDTNLSVALTDYARRNRIFDTKVDQLLTLIIMRDSYRTYIGQLAEKGKSITEGSQGTTIAETDSIEEAEFFLDALTNATSSTSNPFTATHNELADRDDPVAHMQYLLRSGDTITGHIEVDDNITIDGVDVNKHKHTGLDGSEKINADSIDFNSITPDHLDLSETPDAPENLRVKSTSTRVVPPGVTLFDVVLAWDVEDDVTGQQYEVNISPVS